MASISKADVSSMMRAVGRVVREVLAPINQRLQRVEERQGSTASAERLHEAFEAILALKNERAEDKREIAEQRRMITSYKQQLDRLRNTVVMKIGGE